MNLADRNHPCGGKEQAGDESGRKKSSLWRKRASWGCKRAVEIIPAEEKSRLGMNPVGRNHPCSAKEQDKDAIARGKARHDLKSPGKRSEKSQKIHGKDQKKIGKVQEKI